jgi:hypothetical protein
MVKRPAVPKAAGPAADQAAAQPTRREVVVQPECHEDLRYWVAEQPRIALKLLDLMEVIMRTPFTIGLCTRCTMTASTSCRPGTTTDQRGSRWRRAWCSVAGWASPQSLYQLGGSRTDG